jgi:1-acyl-sn-glycerol-3-phosphate acyltransferase
MTTTPQTPPAPTEPTSNLKATSNLEPPTIPLHLRLFTNLFAIPLMAAATAFFGCISLLCGLWDRSGRQQHFVARIWARTLLRISFSPVQVIGSEKFKHAPNPAVPGEHRGPRRTCSPGWELARWGGPAVYASNHLSYMDTPVLFARLPFQFRILAKGGLWKVPFVGWYLNRSGQVPIHSGSPRSMIAGLLRGVHALQSGMPLVVFPEGSRSPTGNLQSFASGCAFMAIRAQVPLIPLALVGTYQLLPIHTYSLRPRPLKIIVGDPISTHSLTTRDADALTAQLFAEITRLYHQHSGPS